MAGAVTAAYGLAVLAFAPMVGRLSRHWPTWRLIGIGGAAAVAGCLTAALSQQAPVATAAAVLLGLAWAAMHSSLQTWATSVLPDARAAMVSLFAGALFAGSALASAAVAGPAGAGRVQRDLRLARGAGRAARVARGPSAGPDGDRRPTRSPMAYPVPYRRN